MEINLLQNCTDQSLSDLINRYQFNFNSMIHLYETVPGLFIEIFLQNHLLLIYCPVSQDTVQKTLYLARMGKCSALCISIKKDNPLDLKRFSGSWFSETSWPSQFYWQLQGNMGGQVALSASLTVNVLYSTVSSFKTPFFVRVTLLSCRCCTMLMYSNFSYILWKYMKCYYSGLCWRLHAN